MYKKSLSWVLTVAMVLSLCMVLPGVAYAAPPPPPTETTVTMLEIRDAIAPINGGTPAATIAETEQYTGTIAWMDGDGNIPTEFLPDTIYIATITLTPKAGYTFSGVLGNAFTVNSAAFSSNDADTGIILANFVSPPAGYITDGNGVMAYSYVDDNFDIMGFYYETWKQTTFSWDGYSTGVMVGDADPLYYADATGEPAALEDTGITMDIDLAFVSGGRALQVKYTVANAGTGNITFSFGSFADIMIGDDDDAAITGFDDGRGFKMVSADEDDKKPIEDGGYEYAQFNFFGKHSVGVTDVDTFWYGYYSDNEDNLFNQVAVSTYQDDSGMAYSWKNRTIGAGETQVYSVVIGIGGAESADVLGYSVSYNDNVAGEVIAVPDTQQKLENVALMLSTQVPVRSGYVFDSWNTVADGSGTRYNPGGSYTANVNLTLYAQWTAAAPAYVYSFYSITAKAGAGGVISPTGSQSVLEGTDKTFSITPNAGYIVFDVLVDGKSVGAVNSYVFKGVYNNHTIEAFFVHSNFTDVDEHDWFYNPVMYVLGKGLLLGTDEDTFDPDGDTTRAMITTILYRLERNPQVLGDLLFSDVESGKWYTNAILWAEQNGIVLGVGGDLFDPNGAISREELVGMLYRYAVFKGWDVKNIGDLSAFGDANQVSPWASEMVRWAVAAGLLSGSGDGLLDPQGDASRAEIAVILMAFMQKYNPGFAPLSR